ncbi:glycosyltransferase family 2 protein [Kangiella sp.]|uniref:glycosyltransferase family 2 protein n=1 Tax=Kangiella sp. TaxID=1920245 RepID=UPI003A927E75
MSLFEKEKRAKVSVCLATYNGEKYILSQIESVLDQLSVDDELIVSDDNSSDSTLDIIRAINDPRIHVYSSLAGGVVSNFENALNKLNGDVVVLCDQDDIWLPGRLDLALDGLKSSDLVMVNYQMVDSELNYIQGRLPIASLSFIKTFYRNGYLGCCMAFRASILPAILPFPKNVAMHDWWIALICLAKFRVAICNKVGVLYRRHSSNASVTGGVSESTFFNKIFIRISMFLALVRRLMKL